MGSEYYIFALFVFLLAAMTVAIYKRTPRSIKKREEKNFEREAKLFKLYQNIEDMLDGFEEYVEDLQRSMEQERSDIERRLEALEAAIRGLEEGRGVIANITPGLGLTHAQKAQPPVTLEPLRIIHRETELMQPDGLETEEQSPPPLQISRAEPPALKLTRSERVRMLSERGFTSDIIAKELGLSQNEVALIIEMSRNAWSGTN